MIGFKKEEIFVVTGASSGFGRTTAMKINELGGTVIAIGRNKERLDEMRSLCKYPDNLLIEIKDLSDEMEKLPKWLSDLAKKIGKIRGLVLSAGISHLVPLRALSLQESKKLFDINLFSNLMLSKGFCDKRVNFGSGSSIVFLSSITALMGFGGLIDYSASKGAVNSVVRAMAVEVANLGIRVNAVVGGLVMTELTKKLYESEHFNEMIKEYPLGAGKPEDIMNACCFLLSDCSRWITGQCITVDGGRALV